MNQYRSGDAAAAVRQITSWSSPRLLMAARGLRQLERPSRTRDGRDTNDLSAACLLHLEVLVRYPGQPLVEDIHSRVMRGHLEGLRRADPLSSRTADLHLGLALHLQGQLRLEDLQGFFEEIDGAFATRGAFLLAEGTLHEVLASRRLEAARRAALAPSARKSLDRAERLLRRALEVAPDLAEARLRLAHVVVRQGKVDEGIALLQPVLHDTSDPDRRYLAYLFLGQAHNLAGQVERAGQAFAADVAEYPCGQAAAIALAHLAFGEGRGDAAREILQAPLKRSAVCTDPWAFYDFGQAKRLDGLISELRRALRQ